MKNIILRGIIFDICIYLLFIYCKNFQLEERSIKKKKDKGKSNISISVRRKI